MVDRVAIRPVLAVWFALAACEEPLRVFPPDSQPPTSPTAVIATPVSAARVNVSWTASTDNVAVTGYRVYRNGTEVGTATGTSYADLGLTAATSFTYRVAAYDAAGNLSAQSPGVSATTLSTGDTQAPTVPAGLTATPVSTTRVNLSWTASTDNVAVTGYRVFRDGTQVGTSTTTTYADSGLTAGTSYAYRVAAYDAAGNVSAQSASVSGTTLASSDTQAPTAPSGLMATPVSAARIDLAWTAATDNVGVTGYRVYRDGVQVGTSATTSYGDAGLGAATSHTYQVAAYDAAANLSGLSNSASGTTLALNLSCTPAKVRCVDDNAGSQQEYTTLQAAANVALAGDTILVFAGNYAGVQFTRSGNAANRIVLLAAESGVVINTDGPTGDGVRFDNANYITVDGFTIQNPSARCVAARNGSPTSPMTGDEVRNITCSGAGLEGFYLSQFSNAVVENNSISGSGRVTPSRAHGIYLANAGSDNTVLRGNRIFNNTGTEAQGIHMNGDASVGGDGLITGVVIEGNIVYGNNFNGFSLDGVQSATFQNNLLYGNGHNAMRGFAIDGAAGPKNLTIVNNTFVVPSGGGWALKLTEDEGGHSIFNNILLGITGSICVDNANVASDNNAGVNTFSSDGDNSTMTLAQWRTAGRDAAGFVTTAAALFVGAAGGNYHLVASAPAINTGRATLNGKNAPLVDLDKTARPKGAAHDIGAYEF